MPYNSFSGWAIARRLLLLWLVCLPPVLASNPAGASEAVIQSDIEVDVSGKDAVDARAKAMAQAETMALQALLERFASPQQAKAVIESQPPSQISAMVKGIEVLSERISDRRYRAHLLVSFDGEGIGKLISSTGLDGSKELNIPTAITFAIVPVYQEGSKLMLWEKRNPWFETWKTVGLESNATGVVVPYGDSSDSSTIRAGDAMSASFDSLNNMTNRYGANQVIILQAKYTATPDMQLNVIKRYLSSKRNDISMLTYRADPQEDRNDLLMRAARDIVGQLQQVKAMTPSGTYIGGERNDIMILASISTMSSWTELKKKLSDLPMVDKVDILAISPQQVDMQVRYRGSEESLELAITKQKLRLLKHRNYWVVSRD